jgi:hypothetical protein
MRNLYTIKIERKLEHNKGKVDGFYEKKKEEKKAS